METLLQCLMCQECFDDGQHIPVALPACGHTFCRPCLVRLRDMRANSAFKCPTCRKEYQECTPENLPCNWVVLNLLNNNHQPKKDEQSKTTQGSDSSTKSTQGSDSSTKSKVWKGIGYGLAATAGAVSLVAAAPVALTAAGFTSAGIASGSLAASMMSSAALANGGGIAAGSMVAALQSAGVAGIGATATGALASTGAGIGLGLSKVTDWFRGKDGGASAGESCKRDDDDGKGDDKDGKRDDDDGKGDDKGGKVDDKDGEVVGKGDDEDSSDDEDDTCWQV